MRKVINKKIYDTETAERIASDEFSNRGDLAYVYEAVYRTGKGNYFFYGTGGPMSKYAEYLGNGSTGGSSIIRALTEEEAKRYILEWDSEAYIKLFPQEIEEA